MPWDMDRKFPNALPGPPPLPLLILLVRGSRRNAAPGGFREKSRLSVLGIDEA
jgi:hypothetical protein